jgi:hypothetical protein
MDSRFACHDNSLSKIPSYVNTELPLPDPIVLFQADSYREPQASYGNQLYASQMIKGPRYSTKPPGDQYEEQ